MKNGYEINWTNNTITMTKKFAAEANQYGTVAYNLLIFDTSRKSGGYSCEIISPSIEYLLFVIDQMKPAILFSRQHRCAEDSSNKSLFSLMLPMVIMQNENGAWSRCY